MGNQTTKAKVGCGGANFALLLLWALVASACAPTLNRQETPPGKDPRDLRDVQPSSERMNEMRWCAESLQRRYRDLGGLNGKSPVETPEGRLIQVGMSIEDSLISSPARLEWFLLLRQEETATNWSCNTQDFYIRRSASGFAGFSGETKLYRLTAPNK